MPPEQIQHLLFVYIAYLIACASPGPSTLAIMGVAMKQGRRPAMALALGIVTGSMCWAILAATGLSAMLTAYAEAMLVIKILGGCYLLYLGWKSARSALTAAGLPSKTTSSTKKAALYQRGFLLHLSNPKAILGWVAIMTLGLQPDGASNSLQAIVVGCAFLGLAVNLGYALIFSTGMMGRVFMAARRWIEGMLAAIFGCAGLRLLLSRP